MSEETKNVLKEEDLAKVSGGSEYEKNRVMAMIDHLVWIYDDKRPVDDLDREYRQLVDSINVWYHAGILSFDEWVACQNYLETRYPEIRALYD